MADKHDGGVPEFETISRPESAQAHNEETVSLLIRRLDHVNASISVNEGVMEGLRSTNRLLEEEAGILKTALDRFHQDSTVPAEQPSENLVRRFAGSPA